jgi:hypothetical protein
METVFLDQPWVPFCLLYAAGWLITLVCACTRRPPPSRDGSPSAPAVTGTARAEAPD